MLFSLLRRHQFPMFMFTFDRSFSSNLHTAQFITVRYAHDETKLIPFASDNFIFGTYVLIYLKRCNVHQQQDTIVRGQHFLSYNCSWCFSRVIVDPWNETFLTQCATSELIEKKQYLSFGCCCIPCNRVSRVILHIFSFSR